MSVFDFHDDLGESFLAAHHGQEVPEILKTAEWKEPVDLLDRDFALIIVDGEGKEHRKFACHDPGNAAMSLWYLENSDHDLPHNAEKVAEHNLKVAMGEESTLMLDASWTGGHVLDERRVYVKIAMPPKPPMAPPGGAGMQPGMMGAAIGKSLTSSAPPVAGKAPMMTPKMPIARTGTSGGMGQSSNMTANMGKEGSAFSPFDLLHSTIENWDDLDYYDRHDAAVELIKQADAGIIVPDHIHQYGGEVINPRFETLMRRRQDFSSDEQVQDNYDRLGKMAGVMDPEDVVEALHLIDEQANLSPRYGKGIPDPLLCVYGQEKQAEWSWIHGGDTINESQLRGFAAEPYCSENMKQLFTSDICDRFKKSPLETFKGMPIEQKIVVARLATQNGRGNHGGYFS